MKLLEPKIHRMLHKVAAMVSDNVPQKDIADVMGVSEGRITQLKDDEKFKEVLSQAQLAKLKQYEEMDDTWDAVELKAIKKLKVALNLFNDPEMALRIAAVANKAVRRSSSFNKPILPMNGGRVELTFSQNFIDARSASNGANGNNSSGNGGDQPTRFTPHIAHEKDGGIEKEKEPLKKIVDILPPAQVEKMLIPAREEAFSQEVLSAMVNEEMENEDG